MGAHNGHQVIQVRRYVYCDVVRACDINAYVDTTGVQNYIINSAKVMFLNHRPHSKIGRANAADTCRTCCRHLREGFSYCSLACKVQSLTQTDAGSGSASPCPSDCNDAGAASPAPQPSPAVAGSAASTPASASAAAAALVAALRRGSAASAAASAAAAGGASSDLDSSEPCDDVIPYGSSPRAASTEPGGGGASAEAWMRASPSGVRPGAAFGSAAGGGPRIITCVSSRPGGARRVITYGGGPEHGSGPGMAAGGERDSCGSASASDAEGPNAMWENPPKRPRTVPVSRQTSGHSSLDLDLDCESSQALARGAAEALMMPTRATSGGGSAQSGTRAPAGARTLSGGSTSAAMASPSGPTRGSVTGFPGSGLQLSSVATEPAELAVAGSRRKRAAPQRAPSC